VRDDEGTPQALNLDPALLDRLLRRHREEAYALLGNAVLAWSAAGFSRFDDHETSCTVRVLAYMRELLDERRDLMLVPVIEGVEPSQEQLEGTADFATAKRADLVLYLCGYATRLCVECKRLLRPANYRDYAEGGVCRFVRGAYAADQSEGAMIGYAMCDPILQSATRINAEVVAHPELGPSHALQIGDWLSASACTYHSTNARQNSHPIVLTHYLVDLC
jgi:hypothetical protein